MSQQESGLCREAMQAESTPACGIYQPDYTSRRLVLLPGTYKVVVRTR